MTLRPVFIDHTSERGGAELALFRLLSADVEWNPTLICPPAEGSDAYAGLPPNVSVERRGPSQRARASNGSSITANVRLTWTLLRAFASVLSSRAARRADVLIANTSRASVYVAVAGTLLRRPVVVHIRDFVDAEAIGGLATKLLRRLVLPRASGLIANSAASLATVRAYVGPKCEIEVIPSPSGITRGHEAVVHDAIRKVGLVARIDPWKGQELLLRAFSKAFPDGDVELVFYGAAAFGTDGYLEHLRSEAAGIGLGDRVRFAGHVDDVAAAIDDLDVCVQCSTRPEPLGQNVLQYLAAGKPTIVADEGGPVEWVRDGQNGLVFHARDEDSLASTLRTIANDHGLRRRLARAASITPGLSTDNEIAERMRSFLTRVKEAS